MSNPFPEAAPDFSDPLGLLRACHERVLAHCAMLEAFAARLGGELDGDAVQAAKAVQRYFATAAKLHHQDEEEDLFPFLVRQSLKLAQLVHELKQDHRRLDALWAQLESRLAWPKNIGDVDGFRAAAAEFIEINRRHVQRENAELLEVAQHIFSSKQLAEIGRSMAKRRNVRVP